MSPVQSWPSQPPPPRQRALAAEKIRTGLCCRSQTASSKSLRAATLRKAGLRERQIRRRLQPPGRWTCSSVEERRPFKPMRVGSNPTGSTRTTDANRRLNATPAQLRWRSPAWYAGGEGSTPSAGATTTTKPTSLPTPTADPVAQQERAVASEAAGRAFKSRRDHQRRRRPTSA